MIRKVRLATWPQVLAMAVVWAGLCLAIDYVFNPHLWARHVETGPPSAPLSLHFHHLRCTGCTDEITKALQSLPWLQGAAMTVRTPGPDVAADDYAGWLDIGVADTSQIDFIALDQAIRQAGYVTSRVEFGGLRHFRLEGKARRLCSPAKQEDCEPLPPVGTIKRGDRLSWLDSMNTDETGSTVIFHVRYQQPNDRIDVKELFTAMDEYGMYPSTLRVVAAPE